MSKIYRTKNGDMADKICHDYYGGIAPLSDVLDANPGLADYGPELPSGVLVSLPDLITPVQTAPVKLWD